MKGAGKGACKLCQSVLISEMENRDISKPIKHGNLTGTLRQTVRGWGAIQSLLKYEVDLKADSYS